MARSCNYIPYTYEEKYRRVCELLKLAKEVRELAGHDIRFTCESDKYKGWEGTIKPSY